MRSRVLTLVLALLMGAVAVVLVYMYVNRVEEESVQGQETRAVLVAARSLPAGTSGAEIVQAGAFQTQEVPVRYVAPGAFTSPEQMATLTLAADVAAGEQLTSQRFKTTQAEAFLAQFPKGTEELSLPLEYVSGVSGHISAGSTINAYVTTTAKIKNRRRFGGVRLPTSAEVFGGGTQAQGGKTTLLLPELKVVETAAAEGAPASSMTLAVTPEEAAVLIHAQGTAKLWFTLVPQGQA